MQYLRFFYDLIIDDPSPGDPDKDLMGIRKIFASYIFKNYECVSFQIRDKRLTAKNMEIRFFVHAKNKKNPVGATG